MTENFDYMMRPSRSTAAEFRARGREKLRGKWGIAILAFFLASILFASTSVAAVDLVGGLFDFNSENESEQEVTINLTEEELRAMSPSEFIALFTEGFEWAGEKVSFWSFLIFLLTANLIGLLIRLALRVFVGAPVTLGYNRFHLDLADEKTVDIATLFSYFKTTLLKSAGLRVLHTVIVSTIPTVFAVLAGALVFGMVRAQWASIMSYPTLFEAVVRFAFVLLPAFLLGGALLLVGVLLNMLLSYRYAFCFMILAEYPELGILDALRNSARIMRGNKWRLFCLNLSFIGWALLTVLTCGIGLFWLIPYMNASFTEFYDEVANRRAAADVEFPSLDPEDYFPGAEQ